MSRITLLLFLQSCVLLKFHRSIQNSNLIFFRSKPAIVNYGTMCFVGTYENLCILINSNSKEALT